MPKRGHHGHGVACRLGGENSTHRLVRRIPEVWWSPSECATDGHQARIQISLHAPDVQVVLLTVERILKLGRDQVQTPQNENQQKDKDGCRRKLQPTHKNDRCEKTVQHQQDVRCSNVGKWKGDRSEFLGVVIPRHGQVQFCEDARKDRRRCRQDAAVDSVDQQVFDPLEDDLRALLLTSKSPQTSPLQADDVQQVEAVCQLRLAVRPSLKLR
mmetsp:Transcript_9200/g.25726  ORF Transcript_9200/g.25726 Transcript_9200/m.25726 type:complete len:213 (+) Transcript_9200:724-1362(+)